MCDANTNEAVTEAVMKAVLALVFIYVCTFFLVIQGASQNSVQAAPQGATPFQGNPAPPQANSSIDPAKEADIRSLMELVGARDVVQVTAQLVGIYDKHFTEDEIKGLLQFYGSPLGQKVAAEMPKIGRETQAATRAASAKVAKDALAEMKQQNPEIGQSARLGNGQGQGRWQQRRGQQHGQGQLPQQQAAQPQDPQ